MNPLTRIMKRFINMPLKKALVLLFICAILLVGTTGCTSSTTTSPTPVATKSAPQASPTSAALPTSMEGVESYLKQYVPADAVVAVMKRDAPNNDKYIVNLDYTLPSGSDAQMKNDARKYVRDFIFAAYNLTFKSNLPIDCIAASIWNPSGKMPPAALVVGFGSVPASAYRNMWSDSSMTPDAFVTWVKQNERAVYSTNCAEKVSIVGSYA